MICFPILNEITKFLNIIDVFPKFLYLFLYCILLSIKISVIHTGIKKMLYTIICQIEKKPKVMERCVWSSMNNGYHAMFPYYKLLHTSFPSKSIKPRNISQIRLFVMTFLLKYMKSWLTKFGRILFNVLWIFFFFSLSC